jgi:hypothetical protein
MGLAPFDKKYIPWMAFHKMKCDTEVPSTGPRTDQGINFLKATNVNF